MKTGHAKMQNVSFRNVDEFLNFLPDDELKITDAFRKLIFNCLPTAIEKLSFNVPYYKHHTLFCFIWPSSVLWGRKKTYDGVRLGFTNGYLMQDELNYLDKGGRKWVYWRDYQKVSDMNIELIRAYIFEAIFIDEQLKKSPYGLQRKAGGQS